MQDKIILGLLLDGDKSSYDLKKNMEASTGFFYNSSQGSIQPALKKLLQNEHVTFNEEHQGARVKRIYSITQEDHDEFNKWVDEAISLEKPRDPALVKMFFSNYVELDRQIEMIEEYLQEINYVLVIMKNMEQISLEKIKNSEQELDNGKVKSRLATLKFGREYYFFLKEWYEKYLRQLKEENG